MSETLLEEPQTLDDPEDLTNAALTEELLATTGERSALVEEPLDTGLWPAVELSEGAVEALVQAMHAIQRDEENQRRDGQD